MEGRTVTLVVVGPDGDLLGQLDPFTVDVPWWQEVLPIQQQMPTLAVLRLLSGEPTFRATAGGRTTYLAEWDGTGRLDLRPAEIDAELLEDHPLRSPWARPGGPGADVAWAAGALAGLGFELTAPPTQHRTWNLSAIWSFAVRETGGGAATVWLKCVPGFFRHEAAVLAALGAHPVPRVLAADAHRILLADMPGVDGYEASTEEAAAVVDELVALQRSSAEMVDELAGVGVPDLRGDGLLREIEPVLAETPANDPAWTRLIADLPRRMDRAEAAGLPAVLVHGDAHPGNARIGLDRPLLFDWGDSRIGTPLLDLAVLDRPGVPEPDAMTKHWLGTWADLAAGKDLAAAWGALRPVAAIRAAAVYHCFLSNIEPTERVYHEGDVRPALELALRLASGD